MLLIWNISQISVEMNQCLKLAIRSSVVQLIFLKTYKKIGSDWKCTPNCKNTAYICFETILIYQDSKTLNCNDTSTTGTNRSSYLWHSILWRITTVFFCKVKRPYWNKLLHRWVSRILLAFHEPLRFVNLKVSFSKHL